MKKYNNYDFQKFSEKFSKLKANDLLKVMIKKIILKKIVVTRLLEHKAWLSYI